MISYSASTLAGALTLATRLSDEFEGLSLTAYPDPGTGAEPWTIGRGSTTIDGRAVQPGDTCTEAQADAWTQDDLRRSMQIIIDDVPVTLNANQIAALTSMVNNIGPGYAGVRDGIIWLADGDHSTLFRCLAAADFKGAAAQIPLWNRSGGRVMLGLERRREAELELFLTPETAP